MIDGASLASAVKINNVHRHADQCIGTDRMQIGTVEVISTRNEPVVFPQNLFNAVQDHAPTVDTLVAEANEVAHLNLVDRYRRDNDNRIPVERWIHAISRGDAHEPAAWIVLGQFERDMVRINKGPRLRHAHDLPCVCG